MIKIEITKSKTRDSSPWDILSNNLWALSITITAWKQKQMIKIHRFIHKFYLLEIWNHTYNKLGKKNIPHLETKKHFSTNCFCSISTTVDSLPPKQRPMRGLEKSNFILLCFLKIIYLNELYIVLSDKFLLLIEKWFYVVIHTVYKTSTWIASEVHWRTHISIDWIYILLKAEA